MSTMYVRGAAAVTGTALALGLGLAVPSAQASTIPAPSGADPAPAASGAAYLASRTDADNVMTYAFEDPPGTINTGKDYGLTIDAAWAIDAVGGPAAKVAAMANALEANIGDYSSFGGGATAKASAFLLSQGRSDATVSDLITSLETDHISTSGPTTGRLVDTSFDFETPLTQAFAVAALNNAGSDLANSALSFLLKQQCTAGFFRPSFSDKAAPDQTCDGTAGASGSPDTTGLAVLMLQDQKSKPVVSATITKALDWLVSQQAANGSFNTGNANSTGLAGWALGVAGRTTAAAKAAQWLRGQQLANAGSCLKYAAKDNGAITLDSLGLANAGTGPLSQIDSDVVTRATAQALPALLWAPGGDFAGATSLTGPVGFVRAGSKQTVVVSGAPGNTVCLAGTRLVLDASGKAIATVTAPASTGKVTVSAVDAGGETDTLSFTALAAAKLTVKATKTVAKGAKVVIKVSGLEAGETVTVSLGRKHVEATANAAGKAKAKLTATKVGKRKVKAVGAFSDRKGKGTLTVTG
jgi:hypothetical protein